MKHTITTLVLAAGLALGSLDAATPEQEKAFVAAYKKAFEAKDEKALNGFLYTVGASAETIEFFKMMQSAEAGKPITSIELTTPTRIVDPAAPALRTNGAAIEPRITPDAPMANSRRVMVISIPSLMLRNDRSRIRY